MYIETPRIIIRDYTPEDAADLQDIFGDDETMENCEPAYVGTDAQFNEFLKMMLHDYLAVDNPYTAKETETEEPATEKPKWQQAM